MTERLMKYAMKYYRKLRRQCEGQSTQKMHGTVYKDFLTPDLSEDFYRDRPRGQGNEPIVAVRNFMKVK